MPFLTDIPLQAAVGRLNLGDMIVVLVMFLILLTLVKKFAWGPVMDMMEKRENYVKSEIEEAEKSRLSAEKLAEEAELRLQDMRKEAQEMMENSTKLAAKQEQDIILAAKTEATRLKESARKDIQQEKDNAIQVLQDQVASLSVLIASKVIEKELSEDGQKELVDQYVKQLGEDNA